MPVAGELSQELTELLFANIPLGIGFSVADAQGIVRFWAGEGFSSCSPRLIGRSLYDAHPKRVHAAIESLLADLKSGRKDEVDTIEQNDSGAERIIYTALRAADGAYRGVLETVVPVAAAALRGGRKRPPRRAAIASQQRSAGSRAGQPAHSSTATPFQKAT